MCKNQVRFNFVPILNRVINMFHPFRRILEDRNVSRAVMLKLVIESISSRIMSCKPQIELSLYFSFSAGC